MSSLWSPCSGDIEMRRYADDITVFVPCLSNIEAVKKVILRYEQRAGLKINFDKSEGLWLGTWQGWRSSPWTFPQERRTHLHPWGVLWARPPTGAKLIGCSSWWDKAEVCAVYIFPLIFTGCLYFSYLRAKNRHVALARWKTDGLQTGLWSASFQWRLGNALPGEPLAGWKVDLPGSILDGGNSVKA